MTMSRSAPATLENKYGENVVRIVVNRFYTIRTNEKRALAQKEKLERELEKLKKRL